MGKTVLHKAVREWFKENGRRAGKAGGRARAAKLSAARKQAIARMGGLARQAKARAQLPEW